MNYFEYDLCAYYDTLYDASIKLLNKYIWEAVLNIINYKHINICLVLTTNPWKVDNPGMTI